MGLDLHFSNKAKPPTIGSLSSDSTLVTPDWWDTVDQNGVNEKPSIAEFNILISNMDLSTFPTTDHFLPISPLRRSRSIYELPIENCFFAATPECNDVISLSSSRNSKKFVRFSDDTIFIERNMESPFWKELTERKQRRKMLREQRRRKRQQRSRSVTLFDLLRILFSKKSNSTSHAKNLKESSSSALQVSTASGDLNYNSFSGTPISFNKTVTKAKKSIEVVEKNSKVHKILRSMQMWLGSSSSSAATQELQIN